MTTRGQAKQAIYLAFQTAWASETAFTFENENFDPPDESPWVRLSVQHTDAGQETLGSAGNRNFERIGSVLVQIYTLLNAGTERSDELVEKAVEIFEGKEFAGTTVRFKDVAGRESGPTGRWYLAIVEADFVYIEKK